MRSPAFLDPAPLDPTDDEDGRPLLVESELDYEPDGPAEAA